MKTKEYFFLQLGNNRIKSVDIESYSLSEEEVYYQKVYVRKPKVSFIKSLFLPISPEWIYQGIIHKIKKEEVHQIGAPPSAGGKRRLVMEKKNGYYEINESDDYAIEDDLVIKTRQCLNISTYQGKNYKFDETDGFDINQKYKEMDSLL